MARKKQGYNARLDESLGERNRGSKSQSLKSRRDESKGTEKAMGKRAYSAVGTMDKGNRGSKSSNKRVVNLGAGGPVGGRKSSRNSDLTPQHKRLAMGQKVPQGTTEVKGYQYGGAIGRQAAAMGPEIEGQIADSPRMASAKRLEDFMTLMESYGNPMGQHDPRDWKSGPTRMRGGGAVKGAVKKGAAKKTKKGSSSRRKR